MHWIDTLIFSTYLILMLGVGFYFMCKNNNSEDFYVGGRKMGALHIGLSVVATDVGGGFSIGLGGLGFIMGISGSWLLFTGLVGAWLTAVVMIPKVAKLSARHKFFSFPQFLEHSYGSKVALVAGVISAIGYIGFTSSQILAGAKLASATFNKLDLGMALLLMGAIAVIYTALGGIKAVIYTDTIQWIVLMMGLIFVAIPIGYLSVGGIETITTTLSENLFKLNNLSWQKFLNWFITIVPIWFIGMTLYQRIYSAKSPKTAVRAWYIAGLFEYPVMAFTGVILGLFARVAFENGMFSVLGINPTDILDEEMGLPLLLRRVLPVGFMGIVMSAYFSAIMSTADSCIMAASGNILTDILKKHKTENNLLLSQTLTLFVGVFALIIAWKMENVLELMLYSYSFMVSGMFIPVLFALFSKKPNKLAALLSMLLGGITTLGLIISELNLPLGLDPNIFGISISLLTYIIISYISNE